MQRSDIYKAMVRNTLLCTHVAEMMTLKHGAEQLEKEKKEIFRKIPDQKRR